MPISENQVYRNTVTNKQFRVIGADHVSVRYRPTDDDKKLFIMPMASFEGSVNTGRMVKVG